MFCDFYKTKKFILEMDTPLLSDIPVWFMCKICQDSVNSVDKFISHKKQKHFTEFQTLKCIVFEENLSNNTGFDFNEASSSAQTELPITTIIANGPVKQEFVLEDESSNETNSHNSNQNETVKLDPEPVIWTENLISEEEEEEEEQPNSFDDEGNDDDLDSAHKISGESLVNSSYNPIVSIERLTAELQTDSSNYSKRSNASNLASDHNIPQIIFERDTGSTSNSSECSSSISSKTVGDSIPTFQCYLCNKMFSSEPHLRIHVGICELYKKKQPKSPNLLSVVRRTQLRDKIRAEIYVKLKTKTKSSNVVECSYPGCGKTFENERFLSCHVGKQHSLPGERKYVCTEENCVKTYKSAANLRDHYIRKHRNGEPFYVCDICDKPFTVLGALRQHAVIHSDDRPFKCPVRECSATFKRKQALQKHEACHK